MRKYIFLLFFHLLSTGLIAQTADFSFNSSTGTFCAPATINFIPTTVGTPVGFIWDFGDGNNSNASSPVHTYSNAGRFQVTLIVIFDKSTATVSKSVEINPANSVGISADRNFICRPGNVSFVASGNNENKYEWNYGDGSSEITTAGSVSHTFNAFQNYTVSVVATDTFGCEANSSLGIVLKNPEISASFNPQRGCIPATANFSASVNIPSGSTVSSYLWDFGDGNSTTTTANNTNHIYSIRGRYSPKLSITTSEGCTATFDFPDAAYGTPPLNIIAYAVNDSVCASDTASLVANATGANQYIWQFGDGTSISTADTLANHKYNVLGTQNVTVRSYDNGCAGSSATFPIEITGVLASFDYNINCSQRDRVFFTDYSSGPVTSFLWDYGDGQQNDSLASPVHNFPSSGSFNTVLTVSDSVSGCSDVFSRTIYTAAPKFTNSDSVICRNTTTIFNVENAYNNPASLYTYFVAGTVTAPITTNSLSMEPQDFGTFNNYVVIDNGSHYCKDTAYLDHQLVVRGPVLDIKFDSAICIYDSTQILNQSHPYLSGETITEWRWIFGNKDTSNIFQPAPYKFPSSGNQSVSVFASDVNGCVDSLSKTVIVNGVPFLHVIPEADTICAATIDTLIAFHNSPVLWTSNQSVNCNNCDTIAVSPNADAYYAVETQSSAGCFSRDTINIKVYSKFAAQAINPLSYICPGDTISLHVLPDSLNIRWTPALGLSNSSGYDPVAMPNQSTRYTAYLSDKAGCFDDSVYFDVNVKAPAIVNAGPDTTLSYNSPFSIIPTYSSNIVKYEWSPSGDLDCIFCSNPTGTAKDNYTYAIETTTDSGCIATDSISVFIECNQASILLPNAFTPNNDNLNDIFYPVGRGISIIKSFSIFDRKGQMIFSKKDFPANDPAYGWDGRINGEPASPAVFVYIIEANCAKGELLSKKGTVVLLR